MDIMNKTYELIDVLDTSSLIKDLTIYKEKIFGNKKLCNLIDSGNREEDKYVLMSIKKELYEYFEYREYMRLYNELNFIVMEINSRYKDLFSERRCCV